MAYDRERVVRDVGDLTRGSITVALAAAMVASAAGCTRGNPSFDEVIASADGGDGATSRPTTGGSVGDGATSTGAGDVDGGPGSATTTATTDPTATTVLDTGPPPMTSDTGPPEPFVLDPCCAPHPSPGCPDQEVQTCTCAIDPFCCRAEWDSLCVAQAVQQCSLACPSDCCTSSDQPGCLDEGVANEVCEGDPTCCSGSWHPDCAAQAASLGHCGSPGGCCEPGPAQTPYCNDPEIVLCTCAIDPFCCEVDWDGACVQNAIGSCGLQGCQSPPGPCCASSPTPGCNDPKVQDPICIADPSCCGIAWNDQCLEAAISGGACTTAGGCCEASNSPGCDQVDVMICVCVEEGDSFCCSSAWDAQCVAQAQSPCAAKCGA